MSQVNFATPKNLHQVSRSDHSLRPRVVKSGKERIPVTVYPTASEASVAIAREIASCITEYAEQESKCVLGLATGSTPVGVYSELVRLHREEGLSFRNVTTFNLDEYYPMQPDELQSYVRFMREHLFDLIDIQPENVHIPDGLVNVNDINVYCAWYEERIHHAGGIDIQLLGVGRTGHIGFNEPGSDKESRTRLITLDSVTRTDAASDFFDQEHVPRRAITMGVGTILQARHVILMAFGEHKAEICAKAVEGPVNSVVAASYLQEHDNAQLILDESAAGHLTRRKAPWLAESVKWRKPLVRKAVIWLALKLRKPILKLTDEDYNESGLQELLADQGPAYDINLEIFRALQATITGWPAGKHAQGIEAERCDQSSAKTFPKRVLIFSPHPDDDVISMGGTLLRLVDQGHQVHVAYQTSGNIAVFDDDALRYSQFIEEFNCLFDESQLSPALDFSVEERLQRKLPGEVDCREVQEVKALIRRGEARAAGRSCGIGKERLHFLDMPFYETGRVKKEELGEEDIELIVDLLRNVQPHQIYAAGDLTDPHGTHRTCLDAIQTALRLCDSDDWYASCKTWLYRGAWQEWEPHEIERAVPLSPGEVERKRVAIYKHESQKDRALFPGSDKREFWQRAEQRNRDTAQTYDLLGLAEYEAIEGFVSWDSYVNRIKDSQLDIC